MESEFRSASEIEGNPMTEKKGTKPRKRQSPFGAALVAAEKRLAEALDEQNEYAIQYYKVSQEIPKLERTVAALRNQQSTISVTPSRPQFIPAPDYTLEQAVSDYPIPIIANPNGEIPLPLNPSVPRPPRPNGGGGAVDMVLTEPEDEDQFLKNSGLPAGEWK